MLTATTDPEGAEVTWSSSNKDVAKVVDGAVEGVKVGTAKITASSGGKSKSCTVTVTDLRPGEVPVSACTIDKTTATIEIGEEFQLTATITPDNATDKTITWTTSSAAVSVENGLVTGHSAGSATVTATAANGKSSKCTVKVVDTPLINNEKFTKEKLYIYAGTFKFLENDEKYFDIRYTFKTDGTMIEKDQVKNTEKTGTYRVADGMLYTYNSDNTLNQMYFYYDNVLMQASETPIVLVKDGSAISQAGTGTLGYYAIIDCKVGDSLGVLTGAKGSAGYTIPLLKNGTIKEKSIAYVKTDQIKASDFVTTEAGTSIIKITIGTKSYNCLFIVRAA